MASCPKKRFQRLWEFSAPFAYEEIILRRSNSPE